MGNRLKNISHFKGCILGGAIGDALGYPVEFLSLDEIRNRYGAMGIRELERNTKGIAEITDDTQMTIFTAEGLLRAYSNKNQTETYNISTEVYYSYLRWLYTQYKTKDYDKRLYNSYLLG